MKEIWKDIKETKGIYQVSNKGKADKMFEELGYESCYIHSRYMFYEKPLKEDCVYENDCVHLEFNFEEKTFNKSYGDDNTVCDIGMQELQAINEKCKELGWLDKEK